MLFMRLKSQEETKSKMKDILVKLINYLTAEQFKEMLTSMFFEKHDLQQEYEIL